VVEGSPRLLLALAPVPSTARRKSQTEWEGGRKKEKKEEKKGRREEKSKQLGREWGRRKE
jgi:hypothetical protein